MKGSIFKDEEEYETACSRIYALMHQSNKPIAPDSAEGKEVELLSVLVEKYEQQHFPIAPPTPLEAINHKIEELELTLEEISPLFGGVEAADAVLSGSKSLTLEIVVLLNKYLNIPYESLLNGKEVKLSPKEEEALSRKISA
jgi:HTH-type transcriptional regulator/antitoxin HigA